MMNFGTVQRGRRNRQRLSLPVTLFAALATTGVHAAITVNSFVTPACPTGLPGSAFNVSVNVTTTGSNTADDWQSTQFTWTDAAGNTYRQCSNQPNIDSDTSGSQSIATIVPAPDGPPVGGGYVSLSVQAFNGNPAGGNCPTSGVSNVVTNPISPACQTTRPNPDVRLGCGQDIILVLDESGSIQTPTNNRANVMRAARALINGLFGTGSRVAIIEFATSARDVQLPNQTAGTYVPVTADTLNDFFAYLTVSGDPRTCAATLSPAQYGPTTQTCPDPAAGNKPAYYTNWEGALQRAQSISASQGTPDLVLVLTDGNPTVNNSFATAPGTALQCANEPTTTADSIACVTPAVTQANLIKAAGAHLLTVFAASTAPSQPSVNNVQAITGIEPLLTGFTTAQFLTADYSADIPFSELEVGFRRAAFALCGSSLSVTKRIDPDGPEGPLADAPEGGVLFRGAVNLDAPATPNNYEWIQPQRASGCGTIPAPDQLGLGCPGPGLASTIGSVQEGRTGAFGALTFQWLAGSQVNPIAAGSVINLREQLIDVPGYAFTPRDLIYRDLTCTRQRLNDNGTFETTSFQCLRSRTVPGLPGGTGNSNCVPVTGGAAACAGVRCDDMDIPVPGSSADVVIPVNSPTAKDILSCVVINDSFRDHGDAPASYGDAIHSIPDPVVSALHLGPLPPDREPLNQPTTSADGDNINRTDDEDGLIFVRAQPGGGIFTVVEVTCATIGQEADLCVWLDGANGGTLNGAFDLGERQCFRQVCKAGGPGLPPAFAQPFTWTVPNTASITTYLRARVTSPTGPAADLFPTGGLPDGEVEDYRIIYNPTAVTIGSVDLKAQAVTGFLDGLDVGGMSDAELLALLAAWDPAAAEALVGADREAILAALGAYLDPDGDGQLAVLRWDTLEQRGTVGFYVDRRAGEGAWERINGDMLPALIGAPLGGEYRLADPTARAGQRYEYTLIEQEAWGSTRSYGPFSLELAP